MGDLLSQLVTDPEREALILSLARCRGDRGLTEGDAAALIEWAETTRLNAAMLDVALAGGGLLDLGAEGEVILRRDPDA